MATPVRLQLSRRKGFDLQARSLATNGLPAVNVARPGPWGNPFVVGVDGQREECARLHAVILGGYMVFGTKALVVDQLSYERFVRANIADLRGKNLACWCRLDGKPCHADTLLKIANRMCEEVRQ